MAVCSRNLGLEAPRSERGRGWGAASCPGGGHTKQAGDRASGQQVPGLGGAVQVGTAGFLSSSTSVFLFLLGCLPPASPSKLLLVSLPLLHSQLPEEPPSLKPILSSAALPATMTPSLGGPSLILPCPINATRATVTQGVPFPVLLQAPPFLHN